MAKQVFIILAVFVIPSDTFTSLKVTSNFQRWLMAQMKAYTIQMNNLTHICLKIVFCSHKTCLV